MSAVIAVSKPTGIELAGLIESFMEEVTGKEPNSFTAHGSDNGYDWKIKVRDSDKSMGWKTWNLGDIDE